MYLYTHTLVFYPYLDFEMIYIHTNLEFTTTDLNFSEDAKSF